MALVKSSDPVECTACHRTIPAGEWHLGPGALRDGSEVRCVPACPTPDEQLSWEQGALW